MDGDPIPIMVGSIRVKLTKGLYKYDETKGLWARLFGYYLLFSSSASPYLRCVDSKKRQLILDCVMRTRKRFGQRFEERLRSPYRVDHR